MMNIKLILPLIFLAFTVFISRVIPHQPNFTAMIAAVVFAASIYRRLSTLFVIFLALLMSDLVINNFIYTNHGSFKWVSSGVIWLLACYAVVYLAGKYFFKRSSQSFMSYLSTTIGASFIFFLLSNFAVWATGTLYPKTLLGLESCFIAAIPFLSYELAGNLFYSAIFLVAYFVWNRQANLAPLPLN
ncbi:MAG TPA: hypothetical protein PKD32_07940 [Saprospiraceae bacterium]|nr:hypothetical protein [Saprospiraceae bacterium]